jgi:hypothetical protein
MHKWTSARSNLACAAAMIGALVLLIAVPMRADAQGCPYWPCGEPGPPEQMSREASYAIDVGANVLIGGLTGGVAQRWNGGSFWRGFSRGAAGGGLVFAGKQVTAARFTGAGVAGRQLAAVGSSVVNNAAAGRPALSRLVLPVGPVRVYAEPAAGRAHAKLDLAGAAAVAWGATRPGARLDLSSTLSSGAPVFRVSREWGHRAAHLAGVVLVSESERQFSKALAHERVHVAQYDFASVVVGEPAESWIASEVPPLQRLYRYVDFGSAVVLLSGLNRVVPDQDKPWENEAHLLAGTR